MSEKTEKPTAKKLRDAKKKGEVAKSKEIVSLALLLAIYGYFVIFADTILAYMVALLDIPTLHFEEDFSAAVTGALFQLVAVASLILAPLLGIVFVVGIVANIGQSGFIFSGESIKLDIKKISPAAGAKKIFSVKNLIEFLKSTIKIVVLSVTAYLVIRGELPNLVKIPLCGVSCAFLISASMVMKLIFYCLGVFLVLAAVDYFVEKQQHIKKLKMSKDEVKREYKEMEGSPEIKGRRKQLHQELMEESLQSSVQQSDLIITNPTRIAVGIRYRADEAPLPWITVKGEFRLAGKIRNYASDYGIPVVERKMLARGLYADAEIHDYIPRQHIEAVAEVIRWWKNREK